MLDLLADMERCNFHRGVLATHGHESTRIYLIRVMDLFPELFAHSDLAQINGLETQLQCRGIALEAEVIFLRRHEQRVGNRRMKVVPALAPFLKSCSGESHLRGGSARARVPIDVVLHDIMVVL